MSATKTKPMPLMLADLLATKGDAAPTPINSDAPELAEPVKEQGRVQKLAKPLPKTVTVDAAPLAGKALTVKLTGERYESLRAAAFQTRKTHQDIMVEAFELWLSKNT